MTHRRLIVLLAFASMLGALSIDAYLPALPAIALRFGVTLAVAQQSLTIFLLAFGSMSLFHGTLSDSFGRRPVMLVGLVIYLLSSLGAGCSVSLGMLMVFRLLQGLSAGVGTIISRAIIGDLMKGVEARQGLALMSVVFGLAPAVAPIMGGWLQATLGWRWIFLVLASFTAVLTAVCWRWLPESHPPGMRHPFRFGVIVHHYLEVCRHRRFMLFALAGAVSFGGLMLYVASAPALIINLLHLNEREFAWLFLPLISGITLGSFLSGRVGHRWSARRIIGVGYAVMAVAAAGNIIYNATCPMRVPWAVMPVCLYGLGASFAGPAIGVLLLEMFPHVRGLTSSLQTFFFMMVFSTLSGVISPLLFSSGLKLALGLATALALSAVIWRIGSLGVPEHVPEEELSFKEE